MRPPSTTSATSSALHALIAAVPIETLRTLVLELMLNGASANMPEPPTLTTPARPAAPRSQSRAGRRRRGWPKGKPRRRGRPRQVDTTNEVDPKLAARRQRAAAAMRARRAAARAAAQAIAAQPASNGAATEIPTAQVGPRVCVEAIKTLASIMRSTKARPPLDRLPLKLSLTEGSGAPCNRSGTGARGTRRQSASSTSAISNWKRSSNASNGADAKG